MRNLLYRYKKTQKLIKFIIKSKFEEKILVLNIIFKYEIIFLILLNLCEPHSKITLAMDQK
jgi:hypothetical protein